MEPGEVVDKEYRSKSRTALPFESRYSQILKDTKLTNTRALIVIRGGDQATIDFTDQHAINYVEHKDVASYLPVVFDMKTLAEDPERQAAFYAKEWPTPHSDELWLVVVDDNDQVLGQALFKCTANAETANVLALEQFLKEYGSEQKNAETTIEMALEEAKRTDRSVWVTIGQTRCNPCFVLARWQDDQLRILEKSVCDRQDRQHARRCLGRIKRKS